jgi:hypothetical protein
MLRADIRKLIHWAPLWCRVVIPVVLIGVPGIALLGPVPDRTDAPLASDTRGWRPLPVPLTTTVLGDGAVRGRMVLRHSRPELLLVNSEIRLLLATLGSRPRLVAGELRFAGTPCTYAASPGVEVADNQYLSFFRGKGCNGAVVEPGALIELALTFVGADAVDVWTYVPGADDSQLPMLELADARPGAGGMHPFVRGRLVTPGPGSAMARIDLLGYVWQVSKRPTWIWAALLLALALMIAGAFLFPWHDAESHPRAFVLRGGVAAACFAAALALLYAVLVPPLHGVDEPDHMLSYARIVHDDRLATEVADLAKLGHFQRIRFHADEAFRPGDVGRPFPIAWDQEVFAEKVEARSPATLAVWNALAPHLTAVRASRVLLSLRLVNVAVFALTVAAAAWLVLLLGTGSYRQLAVLPFFLVPTLPFFAMHVSDSGLLTSVYVLLAAAILVLVMDGPRAHFAGLPLGLGCALACVTNRSAGPLLIVIAAVLAGRVLLGSRSDLRTSGLARRSHFVAEAGPSDLRTFTPWTPAIFWGGLVLGVASTFLFTNSAFWAFLENTFAESSNWWVRQVHALLEFRAWWLLAGAALGAAIESVFLLLRRRLRWSWPNTLLAWLAVAVAIAIVAEMIASIFVSFPALGVLQVPTPPSARQYVWQVLTVMGTSFRVGEPDHLLVRSFWAGFGWIDTLPSPFVTSGLMLATALAVVSLLLYWSRHRDGRRLGLLLLLAGGLAASLAAYALTSRGMQRNLHGRYLVGWYLCGLAAAWSLAALLPPVRWRGIPLIPRTVLLLTACGAVHAYCLVFILQRYFQ